MNRRPWKIPIAIGAIATCCALLCPASAFALQARLSWSAASGSAGYKVYVRPLTGTFGSGLDVGSQSAATDGVVRVLVGNVAIGDVFAVSTYDGDGIESARSNEVPLLALPALVPTATPTLTLPLPPIVTKTPTPTTTPILTSTPAPTRTSTPVPTATATARPTTTVLPTLTTLPTVTAGPSATPTHTAPPLPTATATPLPTQTLTARPTVTPTRTALPTLTPTRTATPVRTAGPTVSAGAPTPGATDVPDPTDTPTDTPVPSDTPTPIATATPGAQSNGLFADLTQLGTIIARVTAPTGGGNHNIEVIRDGDWPPPGNTQSSRQYDTFDGLNLASEDWIGYAFATPQRFRSVIFQEGRNFWDGGWFETLTVQVRQNGVWSDVDGLAITPPYPGVNAISYETFAMTFTPVVGDAIRIDGQPGGSAAFISVGELRVMGDNLSNVPAGTLTDVTTRGAIIARVTAPTGGGNHNLEIIRDGDLPPVGNTQSTRQYDSYDGQNSATEDWIGYAFAQPQQFRQVLFQEGKQFWNGGWFETLAVQVRQNGTWTDVGAVSTPAYPGANGVTYERFALSFPVTSGDAIRIYGRPGGASDFISVGELRVYTDDGTSAAGVPAVETAPADPGSASSAPTADGTAATPPTPAPDLPATGDGGGTGDVGNGGSSSGGTDQTPVLCGNGVRDDGEQCDGDDDAQCARRCRADCTCGVVIELPLFAWWGDGDATATLLQDDVTGAPVLAVTAAAPLPTDGSGDVTATGGAVFGTVESLGFALPQLAVTARASAAFDLEATVRADDGTVRVLGYRAAGRAPDQDAPQYSADGTQAIFDVGAAMAGGEVGTTYRDLVRDLDAAFGLTFESVAQVRVRGSLELFRVALASDRASDEDTAARLVLPLAGWDRRGNGAVLENVYDADLPGVTVQVDPSDRPVSVIQLTYPPAEAPKTLPFGTLLLAIRDADPFEVEVFGITTAGDTVDLTYTLGATDSTLRLRRADQPLVTTPRPSGPYADVRLDVAADAAMLDDGQVLAGIKSIQLRGAFIAGDVQVRDPLETPPAP